MSYIVPQFILQRQLQSNLTLDAEIVVTLDYLSLSEIAFEWSDSYDDKDWKRLRAILAPTLLVRIASPIGGLKPPEY